MSLFDRSLAAFETSRPFLPCLACACVLIAGKIEMIYPPAVEDLYFMTDQSNAPLSDRIFSLEDVIAFEGKVCKALSWRINCVTVQHFRTRLKEAARLNSRETGLFDYLLELSHLEASLSSARPSKVAAACLYLTLRMFRRTGWNDDVAFYSTYTPVDFAKIVPLIHAVHARSEEGSYRAIYAKYRSSTRERISLITALPANQLGLEKYKQSL